MRKYNKLFLKISIALFVCFLFYRGSQTFRKPASEEEAVSENKVVFLLLDGTNEEIFSSMLESGELKFLSSYLKPNAEGDIQAIYSKATTVWPSTTGPAYAPFVSGVFPNKSHLSGIRQYFRKSNEFRSYPGSDLSKINDDLNKDYATIYEFLGEKESYNGQGFVNRRGWKEDGKALFPKVQSVTSLTGIWNKGILFGLGDSPIANDYKNIQTFLAHVSPRFDFKMRSYRAFSDLGEDIVDFGPGNLFQLTSNFFERIVFKMQGLSHLPKFSFVSLHAPDITSHGHGTKEEYRTALRKTDLLIGGMMKYFSMMGYDKKLTLIISADHGTDSVNEGPEYHASIVEKLNSEFNIPIKDSPRRITFGFSGDFEKEREDYVGVAAVSGNANVHLYMRSNKCNNDCKWSLEERPSFKELTNYRVETKNLKSNEGVNLLSLISTFPQVQHVFAKDHKDNAYFIFSQNGKAKITTNLVQNKKHYSYEVIEGDDPLELESAEALSMKSMPLKFYDGDLWAMATKNSNYPDSIVQIVQLLNADRSGDIIIDAKKGYEPWDEMQQGLHGSLRKDHILVPFYVYSDMLDHDKAQQFLQDLGRYPRTVDAFPTIMKLLNVEIKDKITFERHKDIPRDRRLRQGGGTTHQEKYKRVAYEVEMKVKTDIDGQVLDLFK